MRATVRRFHSPDVDLPSFRPVDPQGVGVLVQMMVGPRDQEGEESFDVVVCTPRWLGEWVRQHGPALGRHHLVIERWDWSLTEMLLVQLVENEEEDDWPRLASKIGRIGKWEFEDYKE